MAVDLEMVADLDPVGLLDEEIDRLDRFFSSLEGDAWSQPTRCEGWGCRDVLAHLATADEYHVAGIEGTVDELMGAALAVGVSGIDSFNEWGVRRRADRTAAEVLEEWRTLTRRMRDGFRRLGADGTVASMIGPYPARMQSFHVVNHAATHADDIGVPVGAADQPARLAWRVAVCEFGLSEAGWPVALERAPGANVVRLGNAEAVLTDQEFIDAVNARLPEAHPLPAEIRDAIKVLS